MRSGEYGPGRPRGLDTHIPLVRRNFVPSLRGVLLPVVALGWGRSSLAVRSVLILRNFVFLDRCWI